MDDFITTHRKEIMLEIVANPDDDLPRLAYADWIEENGYDMDVARLIRLMIEANDPCNGCKCYGLQDQALDLAVEKYNVSARLVNRSSGDIEIKNPYRGASRIKSITLSRGFISEAVVTHDWWLECGPWAAKLLPLREIWLQDFQPIRLRQGGRYCFIWGTDAESLEPPHMVPEEIATFFPGTTTEDRTVFATSLDATNALSIGLIKWARLEKT